MNGQTGQTIDTALSGYELLNDPLLNKGTAFTEAERDTFDLHGLLPPDVTTLERQIKRMLEEGLIEELTTGAAGADERRRYYRITKFGKRVAAAEAERMTALLTQARLSGLVRKA